MSFERFCSIPPPRCGSRKRVSSPTRLPFPALIMYFNRCSYVVAFGRGPPSLLHFSLIPLPVGDLGHVLSVLGDILLVLKQLLSYRLFGIGGAGSKLRQAINDVAEKMKSIEIVHHHHVERRACRAFFLVAAHVQILVVCPPVRESMDQPGVAVEGEHDRLVLGEERNELPVTQAMRMLALRLQSQQVDDIDVPNLQR